MLLTVPWKNAAKTCSLQHSVWADISLRHHAIARHRPYSFFRTEMLSHTQTSFHTHKVLLNTHAFFLFSPGCFYTQKLSSLGAQGLHARTRFYTQTLLQAEAFAHTRARTCGEVAASRQKGAPRQTNRSCAWTVRARFVLSRKHRLHCTFRLKAENVKTQDGCLFSRWSIFWIYTPAFLQL